MRLVILTMLSVVLVSCQAHDIARQDQTVLEIRPASYHQRPGWEAFEDTISGRTIYADPQPLLVNADIKRASRARDNADQLAVSVTLTDDAGDRLFAYTRQHISEPLAITLDGKLLSAPTVLSGLRKNFLITGGPTGLIEEKADIITRVVGQGH